LLTLVAAAVAWAAITDSAQAEIRIGLAVPLSGRQAPVGLAMRRALERGVTDLNADGGLLGETLALSVEDDGCAQATAEGAARKLVTLAPAVVIGHPCSGAAAAAAPIYAGANLLLIAIGTRHPGLTAAKSSAPLLRLAGRDDRQGEAAARWLLDRASTRHVAIVHDRTAYARAIADGATAALAGQGVLGVPLLPIVAGKPDYGDIADKIASQRAEAVVFAGFPEEGAIVLAALRRKGLAIPFLGSDALATPHFAEIAEKDAGVVRVLMALEPGDDGARARAALEAWAAAAKRLGTRDGMDLNREMRKAPSSTSLGEIRFDQNGDLVTDSFVAGSAHNGAWARDK
jgi:branched-chain amino acid transport system substrate-binding protein